MSYLIFIYSVVILVNVSFCQIDGPTQPTWTVDDQKEKRPIKVEANLKNLLETASIRSEINSAVRHHKYVVGGEDEEKIVEEADRELGEDYRSKYGLLGAALDLPKGGEKTSKDAQDSIYKLLNIIPNQVASDLVDESEVEEFYIPEYRAADYQDESDTREMLQINEVEADLSFWLGEGVREWRSYPNGDLVGILEKTLILVRKIDQSYQQLNQVDFGSPLASFETFILWNRTDHSVSNMAVVSQGPQLVMLRISDLSIIWKWSVETEILALKHLESDNFHFLAVLNNNQVLLYQFDLSLNEYWITQTIPVESSSREIQILDSEESDKGYPHFVKMAPIPTTKNTPIHTFKMGGYSYLAVGGDEPTIYRYHYGAFRPQTILDPNFGFVDQFLAIPCRTYRDDMILLVQHKIFFETHFLSVVEALIWNGVAFEATKSVPCKIGESTELFGVSCLLDIDREEGLKGAAVVNYDGYVAVLVPRFEAPSGLFRVSTELVPKRTEIEDLEFILWRMEAIIAHQDKAMEALEDKVWSFSKLNTRKLIFGGDIEKLYLNNEEWTEEDAKVDLDQLLADLEIMHRELQEVEKDMTVDDITVKDLFIENVNGQPFEQLREINHNGTIIIEGDLIADEYHQPLLLKAEGGENIGTLDLVEIEGDLEFKKINDITWEDFIGQVVYTDEPVELNYLKVDKLIVDGDMSIETLNNFSFPDDFLLSSGPKTSRITGKKTFVNMLNANAVDCAGEINNIRPSDFITLGQEQNITGTTTFTQLEVTKSFEINGKISGKDLESYVTNPTLLETNKINAECQFRKLIVDGPIIIKGLYNKRNFDETLDDIVYKNEDHVVINSTKRFKVIQLEAAANLTSNKVNDVHLDEFVTKSTDQTLDIREIDGDVYFKNLQLDGLFNSINVTALDLNSIRLDEDLFVNTTLIFKESEFFQSDTLEVEKKLNGIPVDQFLNVNNPIYLKNVSIDHLNVDKLNVLCDIEGDALFNGINLTKFNEKRFSLSQNQTIKSNIIADETIIQGDLIVKSVNNFPVDYLLEILRQSGNISAALSSVKHIKVLGNVTVKAINGMDSEELWSKVIWLDRPNKITEGIQFLDKIVFKDDLTLESKLLNKKNFEDYLDDLVLKTDDHVYLEGPKKFTKPIQVGGDATIDMINDIPGDLLATKVRPMKIEGDLSIKGDLEVHSLDMEGEKFGELDVQEIFESYQYDSATDMHYISGTVTFKGNTVIDQLHVGDSINGHEGPNELFQHIVFKNDTHGITGRKTFKNLVQFDEGFSVHHLNGVNIVEFFDNVVYINQKEPVEIDYPVVFKKPVTAEQVHVGGSFHTSNVMGCELKEWLDNCLRIDRPSNIEGPLYFAPGALDGNSLKVSYVNGLPMSKVITLNTPQEFTESISLPYVYLDEPMIVEGTVNGVDIVKEYKNTFKISGNQNITAPIEVTSIQVLHNMETLKPIDGRDLREVAALHDNLVFRSSLTFKHITVDQLITDDHISGLNFSEWYQTSFKTENSENQPITGEWTIDELHINTRNVTINPPVTVGNISDLMSLGKQFREYYAAVCEKTMKMNDISAQRVSFVKYLKKDLELVRKKPIDSMFSIEFVDSTLVLINEGCISKIYKWDITEDTFKRIGKMETGSIVDVETHDNHTFTTHATMPDRGCKFLGSMVWQVDGRRIIMLALSSKSNGNQEIYRYKKRTRCTRSVKEEYPDFNAPIDKITSKMVDDLQVPKVSDFPFVASAFGDSVKGVATKLWAGLTQLDDVKTIIHHATKIYHSLSDKSEQDQYLEASDKMLGATGPTKYSVRPDSPSLKVLQRLETILDVIPLGFGDLVASARSPVNDHDFESQLRRLVTGITNTFHSVSTQNQPIQSKRSLEHIANVSRSLETLRQFAEGYSELEDIYNTHESTDEIPEAYTADITEEYREAITFQVGSRENRHRLIAVISPIDYQSIRLYDHSLEGDTFQTIHTRRPFKLTSLEIQEETILAFIDYYNIIRVMKYKGVGGFVEWSSFRADSDYPVTQLMSLSLAKSSSVCRSYYLVSAWMEHIQFYEIVLGGMCPVKATVENCNGWW